MGALDDDAGRVRVELEEALARLARVRAELAALDADVERRREESRGLDVEIALRRGALELLGKEPGADPENLTSREKAILVRGTSEAFGLPVAVLLARVGLARSTYFHQLRAMARPDRDEGLLALVRDAFEDSGRRYGYRRVWLALRGNGVVVSARRVMRLMTRHGLVPPLKRTRRYSSYRGEIGGEAPVIHSDRGCHYRWPEWIRICEEHGLTRSMSAKGCSPDNAAAEGFFGRLKQEFLHCRDFAGIGMDEFIRRLDGYMTWYRDERIKLEYGTSIRARRRQLGLMA